MMEKYPGIEKSPLFKVLEQCMTERISQNIENKFTFPDQSVGYFELRIQPVPEGIFILSIDISERKQAELEKTEYVKSLEDMIFMTSHNIRQPIAQIQGIRSLLDTPIQSQEELTKIAEYLRDSIIYLDNFTKEFTTFIHSLKQKIKYKGSV